MNINIAFNTIIYIMVFFFPGFLFRSSFLSGKLNSNLDPGNSAERLLWNILLSVICIVAFCFLGYSVDTYTNHNLTVFQSFKAEDIINNFRSMYENQLPSALNESHSIINVFIVLFNLYLFSAILGYTSQKIVFWTGLDKRLLVFRHHNNWKNLTKSTKRSNEYHQSGGIYYTTVDIKTKEKELFSGKLHDIILDKDGKIYAIAIQEAYKYYTLNKPGDDVQIDLIREESASENNIDILFHSETDLKFIYKKRIKGSIFTVFQESIENISITHIKISHIFKKIQKAFRLFISLFKTTVNIFFFTYIVWDFGFIDFKSTTGRAIFCLSLYFIVNIILMIVLNLFERSAIENEKKLTIKELSFILLFFATPLLYSLDVISFIQSAAIIILLFIIAFIFIDPNKDNNEGPGSTEDHS